MIKVINAKYISNYLIEISLNDGRILLVNLEKELDGEVFEPLKQLSFFKTFILDEETGTITWPNGADFAPEFFEEIGKEVAIK